MDQKHQGPQPTSWQEKLRLRLATVDNLPQLALLGVICGFLVGFVIVAFRILIEMTQASLLFEGQAENYALLSPLLRLLIAVVGGLCVGLLFQYIAKGARVGVVHVMERLAYHQGRLPLRNALWQFVGSAITIISGHSVGREGPGVHLGATSGSLIGQVLRLPNNSTRILVSCGVAAAIAASFNTPLAGVIFSMEVVMMEYTIAGFTPVILAAVCATAVLHWAFSSAPVFNVPVFEMQSLLELPYAVIMGLVIGSLAALFITLLQGFSRVGSSRPLWQRTTVAGLIVGLCGLFVPQVMGIGYGTVNASLIGELGFGLLFAIVLLKILATTSGIGLGLPGGLIGPTLVIGATAGAMMGATAEWLFPEHASDNAFYVIIGMAAMMGATLQAPLAALMAILELTANPNIILPGMLAVIASGLTSSELFNKESVFIMLMKVRGLDYRNDPVAQSLRRLSIANAMNRNIATSDRKISIKQAQLMLEKQPHWIVIMEQENPRSLLPAADLAMYLNDSDLDDDNSVDLIEIPAQRRQVTCIDLQANLQEALDVLEETQAESLCITHRLKQGSRIDGILTKQDIEQHYQYKNNHHSRS